MPPQKGKGRTGPPQAPPQPSDYETDAPPAALDVPRPPPRTNEELNLSVLRRIWHEVVDIEHVAEYAALYTFNLESEEWEKLGVQGTLFIGQLSPSAIGAERYCVIILNRRGLDNFYLELTRSEDIEISDPYVILQGDTVYGLWIFAEPPPSSTARSRVETGERLLELADRASASRKAKEKSGGQPVTNGAAGASAQPDAASSVAMGRQLSLSEMFDQQRQQDAGFSVHTHNSHPLPNAYQQQDVLGQLFMKAKQDYNGLG